MYKYVIQLKKDSVGKEPNTYDIFIWDEDNTKIITQITDIATTIPIQINKTYFFVLCVNDEIFCVGKLSNSKEINYKVYISYDYLEINESPNISIYNI